MSQTNFNQVNGATSATSANGYFTKNGKISSKGAGSKTPYKRKYGFDLLKQIDPFFLQPGELEAAAEQHELMSRLLSGASVLSEASRKEFVQGQIVAKVDDAYLVNIGRKYDAVVPVAAASGLSVNDNAEFFITGGIDRFGMVQASANLAKGWRNLEDAQDSEQIFQVRVFSEAITKRNQKSAGLRFIFEEGEFAGIRGFIPNAEIARNSYSADMVGQLIEVCVLRAESQKGGEHGNLVASHRLAQTASDRAAFAAMEVDTIVAGIVVDFIKASPKDTKLSALVRLDNGIVAMLHRSETVDNRHSLNELYKVGSEISAAVRSIDEERGRIGLSLKLAAQLNSVGMLEVGQIVESEVLRIVPYGYFCSIGGGLEGLIHRSDLQKVEGQNESFNVGQVIESVVLSFEEDGSRLALGRKQLFS
jgi:small subunit ribosomal protein S1